MKRLALMFVAVPALCLSGCGDRCCCPDGCACNPVKKLATGVGVKKGSDKKNTKQIIQQAYGAVAKASSCGCAGGGCCGGGADLSQLVGYTKEELAMFADANLGLGCGHPVSLGYLRAGETVLDLGSGAGLDCFLASRKVGKSGHVIGVDMTQVMIDKARANAKKYNITNVEFRLGDIEALPVQNDSIDVIMSNCVINLAPNKKQVYQEAFRVLKHGGKMAISDVVLTKELTAQQKRDTKLLCACVSGALLKSDYIGLLEKAGFEVTVVDEDKDINQKWFGDRKLPISSLKFIARKK